MTQLSRNFTLAEFCKSQAAERFGLDNTPNPEVVANATALAKNVLQPLRDKIRLPIVFSSGYRSPAVNKATGGVPTSQHLTGQAADIECPGISNYDLATWIYHNLPFDQLILEFVDDDIQGSGWVHVSYRDDGNNRKQALQIDKNGKREWKPK
jgi:zinc D-Ala-D-Ala carboxypeptidase